MDERYLGWDRVGSWRADPRCSLPRISVFARGLSEMKAHTSESGSNDDKMGKRTESLRQKCIPSNGYSLGYSSGEGAWLEVGDMAKERRCTHSFKTFQELWKCSSVHA
jgi:hypothetical protein